MKSCNKNRKSIAWLAAGVLDTRQARELRTHFETCDDCRAYWNELSRVTEKLAAVEITPRMEAGPVFQQRLAAKLRAVESRPAGEILLAYLGRAFAGWRIAIPATVALALAALVLTMTQHRPVVLPSTGVAVIKNDSPERILEIPPTIGNYEMAASESLDKLDELLTKEGSFSSATTPSYTASMLKTPGTAD